MIGDPAPGDPQWQSTDPTKPFFRPAPSWQSADPTKPFFRPGMSASDATSVPGQSTAGTVSLRDAARLAEDQLTFGIGKRVNAAVRSITGGDSYANNVKDEQAQLDAANGKFGATGAKIAGNIPWLFGGEALKALGLIGKGAEVAKAAPTVLDAAKGAAATGAKFGAASGLGHSPILTGSDAPTVQQLLDAGKQTAEGAAAGTVLGGTLGAAGAKIGDISKGILDRTGAAARSSTRLSVGQVLNSPVVKGLETAVSVLPTARGVMARFGGAQSGDASAEAQRLAELIGNGSVPSREVAGANAQAAASRIGASFEQQRRPLVDEFKALVDAAHTPTTVSKATANAATNGDLPTAVLDDAGQVHVAQDGQSHAETMAAAQRRGASFDNFGDNMAARRGWIDAKGNFVGMGAVGDALGGKTLRGGIPLSNTATLVGDLSKLAQEKPEVYGADVQPVVDQASQLIKASRAGKIDAGDLLRLRTKIGMTANFDSPLTAPDPSQTYLKQLYGSLTDDLDKAAETAGPRAQELIAKHDAMVQGFRGSNAPGGASFWNGIENAKSPGQAFDMLTHHPDNSAGMQAIRAQMTPQELQPIAARHFLDLSKANPGVQNAEGNVFSPETFMSRWNGKGFTPEVKSALYGDTPLSDFANTMSTVKSSAPFRNPSGTAGAMQGAQFAKDAMQTAAQGAMVESATHSPMTTAASLLGPPVAGVALTSKLAPFLLRKGAQLASPSHARTLMEMLTQTGANLLGAKTGNQ